MSREFISTNKPSLSCLRGSVRRGIETLSLLFVGEPPKPKIMNTDTCNDPRAASPDSKVDPVPKGMHTVTPHLVCAGAADAIEFYKKAFGAVEMCRMPMPDGKIMHAAITIGDSMIMLVDEMPDWNCLGGNALGGSPVTIHLQVENVDALYDQAVKAGATAKMPVGEMFWGDRYGVLVDPFGHNWSIATHVRDVSPEEMMEASKNMCGGCGEA
jgi:PhnB protein